LVFQRLNRHFSWIEDESLNFVLFFCPPSPLFSLEVKYIESSGGGSRRLFQHWCSCAFGRLGRQIWSAIWFAFWTSLRLSFSLLLHLRTFEHKVVLFLAEIEESKTLHINPLGNLEIDITVVCALLVEDQVSSTVTSHNSVWTNVREEVIVVYLVVRQTFNETQVTFGLHHNAICAEEIFLLWCFAINGFFFCTLVFFDVVHESTAIGMLWTLNLLVLLEHAVERSPGRIVKSLVLNQRNNSGIPVQNTSRARELIVRSLVKFFFVCQRNFKLLD